MVVVAVLLGWGVVKKILSFRAIKINYKVLQLSYFASVSNKNFMKSFLQCKKGLILSVFLFSQ